MNIIVLSQWYPPEPESKIHLLARDLVARGHVVTSITGIPNYPTGEVYHGYGVRPWPQRETRDGVRVVRVPLYPDHSRSAVKRVLNYTSFAMSAAAFGPALSGPADVMWVFHPPLTVALPATVIATLRGIPFVYEVQDMWPETLAATGMVRSPRLLSAVNEVANRVYRRADRITVISPGFKRNLVGKGVPASKIEVIPNWADEETYRPFERDDALACECGMEGKFNVLYAGNLGAAQRLGNVLDAAARLRDLPDLQFVLVGDGVEERELRRRAAAEGLDNVRFLGRMPAHRIASLAAVSEVLLVHLKRDPLFEITIPSKTISALACGRPVLSVTVGDAAEVIEQAGAGLTCAPEQPAELSRCVRALYNMPAATRQDLGRAARNYFLTHFTRTELVTRYESLLTEVAAERRATLSKHNGRSS